MSHENISNENIADVQPHYSLATSETTSELDWSVFELVCF